MICRNWTVENVGWQSPILNDNSNIYPIQNDDLVNKNIFAQMEKQIEILI